MSKIMTKRSEIATYWKTKSINKNTFKIIDYEDNSYSYQDYINIIINEFVPRCWACGCRASDPLAEYKNFEELWDSPPNTFLERCHILPRLFGGEDMPSNLFLLCNHCHYESPDTNNPDNFFAWIIYKRRTIINDYWELFNKAAEMKHLNFSEINNKIYSLPKGYYILNNLYKRSFERCALHGFNISKMSSAMAYIDEIVEFIEKHNL